MADNLCIEKIVYSILVVHLNQQFKRTFCSQKGNRIYLGIKNIHLALLYKCIIHNRYNIYITIVNCRYIV